MKTRLLLSMMVTGMAALVGCQTDRSMIHGKRPAIRGQTPASCGPNGGMPYGAMQHGGMPGPGSYGPGGNGMNCPPAHNHPNGAECPMCAPDNFHGPTHHHTYDYRQPSNLTYPPQNQPAGTVVYPYYTHKGPSDFFMK